ncbi:LysE family translocator [Vibrio tubiashii]|uniref:LysE family translocator n=1 Tax=Vibrio tubiashii TaxID=29498 RepID=UPI001EFDC78A|nr:LysE family translocator [Vibrio tubiashii]MCG9578173.1 LysE family translocator [Vibrio tubiashii]
MELVSLALLGILIVISPGADFVLVLRNSLNHGRKAGVMSALGISLAIGVHIAYSMLGISYLISQNEWLFNLVRYLGAGYLIYLGLRGLFARSSAPSNAIEPSATKSAWRYLGEGFLCNVLNPKTMLFFLSIFSQVMINDASSNNNALIYGGYMMLLHGLWFVLVALLFSSNKLQTILSKAKHRLNQLCGAGLLLFGLALGLKN